MKRSIFSLVIIFLIFSCQKEDIEDSKEISSEEALEIVCAKYELNEVSHENFNYKKVNIDGGVYNVSEARFFQMNSGEQILIIPQNVNADELTVIKFFETEEGCLINKEISVAINMDCEGNGFIDMKNKGDGSLYSVSYVKGKVVGSEMFEGNRRDKSISAANGLCQREGDEKFGDCFKRESDEFQSDFIGALAYNSNPSVPILIAALCTC